MGTNIQMDDIGPIPASAVVVSKAPQTELLKRAELCITHAGINTTLESLALGVPMVAIPVGFDQPGIAARIVYHGVGQSVPVTSMNEKNLSGAIHEVLGNPSYRDTACRFQRTIAQTHGLDRAADVLERAFQCSNSPRCHDCGTSNFAREEGRETCSLSHVQHIHYSPGSGLKTAAQRTEAFERYLTADLDHVAFLGERVCRKRRLPEKSDRKLSRLS
jgi:hypothetical protein